MALQHFHLTLECFYLILLLLNLLLLLLLQLLDVLRRLLVVNCDESFAQEELQSAVLTHGLIHLLRSVIKVLNLLLEFLDLILEVVVLHVATTELIDFLLVLELDLCVLFSHLDTSRFHLCERGHHAC